MTKNNKAVVRGFLRSVIGVGAASLVMILGALNAHAAEWRIEPMLGVAGEFDDNADLTVLTILEQEISGYVVDAAALFGYESPVTSFFATPRLRYRDYNDPDFDANDSFFRFGYDRTFEHSFLRIHGNYGREKARTAERADAADLDLEDPEEIPVDDSGRVFVRDYRERVSILPRYTYSLSQISTLGLSLSYTDTTYDDALAVLLSDYTDARATLSYRRSWSPRNTAILSGTYRTYESNCPTCGDAVTGYGIRFGAESRLSETMTLLVVVGAENTELETGVDVLSPVGTISLNRNLETISLFAQYQRVISGGGGGSLSARDIVNLNFRRRLNDLIFAGLGIRGYKTDALEEGPTTIDERDYIQLRALIGWNLTEDFSLEAQYRYTIIYREIVGESANSNNIMLWVHWRPTPWTRSR